MSIITMARPSRGHRGKRAASLGAMFALGLSLGTPAKAAQIQDYLAHGFRIERMTFVPGTFTGCVKDQAYSFADGSLFTCKTKRSAFALRPRVQVLISDDRAITVLLIGGRAYKGGLTMVRNGVRTNPIPTVTDMPFGDAAARPPSAVAAIVPVEAIDPLEPLPDEQKLRSMAVQSYPQPRPGP